MGAKAEFRNVAVFDRAPYGIKRLIDIFEETFDHIVNKGLVAN